MKTKTQVRKETEGSFPPIPIPENWAEAWEERKVVHTFDDGWTIEVTETKNDRYHDGKNVEGVYSCIYPGYGHRFGYLAADGTRTDDPWGDIYLPSGKYMILSIRDPKGKPYGHMTFGEANAVVEANTKLDRMPMGKVGVYFNTNPGWKGYAPKIINEGEWCLLECVTGYNQGDVTTRCREWYTDLPRPEWAEGLDFTYMRQTCSDILRARKAA